MGLLQKLRNAIGGEAPAGERSDPDASTPEATDEAAEPGAVYRCQRCRTEYSEDRALCDECGGSVREVTA